MAKKSPPVPTAPLKDLVAWWKASRVKGLIVGGLAVCFLAKPRYTLDVDAIVIVEEEDWKEFLKLGRANSFQSRISDPLEYAKQSRMFVLTHTPSGIEVDLMIANSAFETVAVSRGKPMKVGRVSVPVISPEDLLVMKSISNRPQDQIDVSQLVELASGIDLDSVRAVMLQYASEMDMPEIMDALDRAIAYKRKFDGE